MDHERIASCQAAIGYLFEDLRLLEKALTHSSIKSRENPSNERLEFLGDAVLGAVVSEYLFRKFADFSEGQLTRIKSVVVSSRTLSRCTRRLGLDRCLSVGKGVAVNKSLPPSILGNAFEAVIAAIYLDGGIDCARAFILAHLEAEIEKVLENRYPKNYKSLLQQLVQRRWAAVPTYRVVEERGPDHAKEFRVCAHVEDRDLGFAWGRSKRAAEQIAAREAFETLRAEHGAVASGRLHSNSGNSE